MFDAVLILNNDKHENCIDVWIIYNVKRNFIWNTSTDFVVQKIKT